MHCNPFFKCTVLHILADIYNQMYTDKYSRVTTIYRTIILLPKCYCASVYPTPTISLSP